MSDLSRAQELIDATDSFAEIAEGLEESQKAALEAKYGAGSTKNVIGGKGSQAAKLGDGSTTLALAASDDADGDRPQASVAFAGMAVRNEYADFDDFGYVD